MDKDTFDSVSSEVLQFLDDLRERGFHVKITGGKRSSYTIELTDLKPKERRDERQENDENNLTV